ncbi:phosphoglucosamine mutase [Acetobacter orientalis NRIC 0481]|uniref:Phosphomanno mutase n=2 Tax=Acetobacter orientalis TaxID=146474 RepID=A0A0D6NJZ3_9PROT|nr:phosphomanno mutase [Acetobacter orientalis]GBR20181.1 phosphoglucosamine mutase [Acetobacter orientalis NRIC 0481]GEL60386.1 phosphomannomutase [Acetobacter orientalis]
MVTGSHIPADRNGIKFNHARGEFLKSDEIAMREEDVSLPAEWFDDEGHLIHPITLPNVTNVSTAFVERYRNFFGKEALRGLKLGIYQHSAVGRDVLIDIVEALGGEAIPLGRSETFVPVDTEAVRKEDSDLAQQWAKSEHYDAILTTDGDSDRPLLADNQGVWLRGDVLGILAAQFLQAKSVATPVSSNTALEKAGFANVVRRTKIGSPYVVAAMTEALADGTEPSVGYEANGGFLLASAISRDGKHLPALPTRDSVLPMLCTLVAARDYGKDLRKLIKTLPPRFTLSDRLAEMPTIQSKTKLEVLRKSPHTEAEKLGFIQACGALQAIDETDGLRMTFASNEVLHLRPSGNAPELRLYVEAANKPRAQELLKIGMKSIESWRS